MEPEHPLQAAPSLGDPSSPWALQLALGKHSEDREARCRSLSSGCRWSEGPGGGHRWAWSLLGWGFLWVTYCPFLCFLLQLPLPHPQRKPPETVTGLRASLGMISSHKPRQNSLFDEETAVPKT